MHDWSVWHGRVPFTDYEKHNPRFMTEYGFQSFPEMRTVESLHHSRKTAPTSSRRSCWRIRRTPPAMPSFATTCCATIAEPKDFASFLYASQVLQAEGIKIGAEHLRRNRPRTMGSIYWQLNDCWPVASWSSLDYYGRWKALHYYARRFYAPVLVSPHQEEGNVAVYVVSDKTSPTVATLRVRILTFDGAVLSDKSQPVTIAPLSSKIYLTMPMLDITNLPNCDLGKIFAVTDLLVDNKADLEQRAVLRPQERHATAAGEDHERTDGDEVRESYTLHLASPVLAKSVYISFGNLDAKPADNYFDLLPGKPSI